MTAIEPHTDVPIWDSQQETVAVPNVLVISEQGGVDHLALLDAMSSLRYFQRLPADTPYIPSVPDGIARVDSWRPHVEWADVIIVDDPSFMVRIFTDFGDMALSKKLLLYRMDQQEYREVARLVAWLNPNTIAAFKQALQAVDQEPPVLPERKPSWFRRLIRGANA